jgi:hypothetical protein
VRDGSRRGEPQVADGRLGIRDAQEDVEVAFGLETRHGAARRIGDHELERSIRSRIVGRRLAFAPDAVKDPNQDCDDLPRTIQCDLLGALPRGLADGS